MYLRILTYCCNIYFCGLLSFSVTNSIAQTVTETVNFDDYTSPTDNDLANKFSSAAGLTQITTDGITGGALNTPSYIEWGDDRAIYQSKYKSQISSTSITSISFKYDGALVNPNNDQRAASIWLIPGSNPDHYHVATIEKNKTLGLLGYQHTSAYVALNLLNNHWYRLQLASTTTGGQFGDRVDYEVTVFELGSNGMASPTSIGSVTGTIYDIKFTTDKAIGVAFTGTKWGGADFMDEFQFNGPKNTIPEIKIVSPLNGAMIWVPLGDSIEIVTTPAGAVDSGGEAFTKTIEVYRDGIRLFEKTVGNDKPVYCQTFYAHSTIKVYARLNDGTNPETVDSTTVLTDNSLQTCEVTYPKAIDIVNIPSPWSVHMPISFDLSPPSNIISIFPSDLDGDYLLGRIQLLTYHDSLLCDNPWYLPNPQTDCDLEGYLTGKKEYTSGTVHYGEPNYDKPIKIKVLVTDRIDTTYCISAFFVNGNYSGPQIVSPDFNEIASFDSQGRLVIISAPFGAVDLEGDSLTKIFHITGPFLDTTIVAHNTTEVYLKESDLLPGSNYSIDAWLWDGKDTLALDTDHTFRTPPEFITGVEEGPDLSNVYPNPFETEIMIALPAELGIERIRIVNTLGQTVFDQRFVDSGSLSPAIPSGTYILEGYDSSGGKKLARRIVRR